MAQAGLPFIQMFQANNRLNQSRSGKHSCMYLRPVTMDFSSDFLTS